MNYLNDTDRAWDSFLDRIAGTGPTIGHDGTYEADLNCTTKEGLCIHGTVTVSVKNDEPTALVDFDPTETYLEGWGEDLVWGGWSDAVAAAYLSTPEGLELIAMKAVCFEPVN